MEAERLMEKHLKSANENNDQSRTLHQIKLFIKNEGKKTENIHH